MVFAFCSHILLDPPLALLLLMSLLYFAFILLYFYLIKKNSFQYLEGSYIDFGLTICNRVDPKDDPQHIYQMVAFESAISKLA